MAADGNPAVQMVLRLAEMVGWLRKVVGDLIRRAGLQADRTANWWGSQRGYCVVMGQKVPIQRPRVRTTGDQEKRLGSDKRLPAV